MADIADLIIEQGRQAAAARAAGGAIWGRAIENIGQIPGQVMAEQRIQREANANAALKTLQLQKGQQEQQDLITTDKIWADPTVYLPDGTINRAGLTDRLTAAKAGHLLPHVMSVADTLDEGRGKIQEAKQKLYNENAETLGRTALKLEAAGHDPGAAHLAIADLTKAGVLSKDQGDQWLQSVTTPEQVAAMAKTWKAGTKASEADLTVVPEGATPLDRRTGQPLPGFTVTPKPKTEGELDARAQELYSKVKGGTATPAEQLELQGFESRKRANDAPVLVKTVENGKLVEKWVPRDEALAHGSYASQPPASMQVNLAAAASAGNPASPGEKAIANYMMPPPSPRTMASPVGKAMMDRILAENPAYDASMYSVRAPTRKAYTTGVQGQQIVAMNTAVEHLDQLQRAADAMKNGSFVPGNAAYNALKETFGSNLPTNYDTIKSMVDHEVEAVASKGVPTVSGTAEQKALAGKKASPAQLKGYIDTLIPLMGSKINELDYAYRQAMGKNDPYQPISPIAAEILQRRESKGAPAGGDPLGLFGPKK